MRPELRALGEEVRALGERIAAFERELCGWLREENRLRVEREGEEARREYMRRQREYRFTVAVKRYDGAGEPRVIRTGLTLHEAKRVEAAAVDQLKMDGLEMGRRLTDTLYVDAWITNAAEVAAGARGSDLV